jgi:hypothetical protein
MTDRAVLATLVVAALAGVGGAALIVFFEDGVGGWLVYPPLYSIPSIITWACLARFVLNRSVLRALLIGLASPVAACALFLPLCWLWAPALLRYWWITIPLGVATSLLIQLFGSDYTTSYRSWPRLAALAALLTLVIVCAAPRVNRELHDPARDDLATIRARLIRATPIGSSRDDVVHALASTISYDVAATRSAGNPAYVNMPAMRYVDKVGYPVGVGRIEATLGVYRTLDHGRIRTYATWAFDERGRVIEVFVRKYSLSGD